MSLMGVMEIGNPSYDGILKLNRERNRIGKEQYDLTLKLINHLMDLKGESKYVAFTQFKNVSEKAVLLADKEQRIKKFKKRLLKHFQIDVEKDHRLITNLRKILSVQGYKLKFWTNSRRFMIQKLF